MCEDTFHPSIGRVIFLSSLKPWLIELCQTCQLEHLLTSHFWQWPLTVQGRIDSQGNFRKAFQFCHVLQQNLPEPWICLPEYASWWTHEQSTTALHAVGARESGYRHEATSHSGSGSLLHLQDCLVFLLTDVTFIEDDGGNLAADCVPDILLSRGTTLFTNEFIVPLG